MLLKELTELNGVSGDEKDIRDFIKHELESYSDSIKVDNMGNLIVHKKGSNPLSKTLMLAAHMDEVGFMIYDIDSCGMLKFKPVGGIDKRLLVSKVLTVGKKKLKGVIGAKPIHLQSDDEWEKPLNYSDLYIDIGAKDKEDAEKHVNIGDFAYFDTNYDELGQGLIKAKALDDRVGCSLLIDLVKSDIDVDFYAVFTVMEEIGLIGAGPAAYRIKPDIAIILEATICYELPPEEEMINITSLGEGPAISLMDGGTIYNRELYNRAVRLAEENGISYQFRKTNKGGNDSGRIHTTGAGAKTLGLALPARYIHGPAALISKSDYTNTLRITKALLTNLSKEEL